MKHTILTTCLLLLLFAAGMDSCRKKSSSRPTPASASTSAYITNVTHSSPGGTVTYYRIVDIGRITDMDIIYIGYPANDTERYSYVY